MKKPELLQKYKDIQQKRQDNLENLKEYLSEDDKERINLIINIYTEIIKDLESLE